MSDGPVTNTNYGSGSSSAYNGPSSKPTAPIFARNSQSDGVNTLRRMEFEFMGESFVFSLNPEEYAQNEPSRGTVTQTKAGAWVDDFGAGIQTIMFRGTTGWKGSVEGDQNVGNSGFWRFKYLRDLVRKYYNKSYAGEDIPEDKELVFHNYTDGEHWVVYPEAINLRRSVARPLLYLYEVQLICLRPATTPDWASQRDTGNLGKISSAIEIEQE